LVPDLHASDYLERLDEGWRRFGPALFRPGCPLCTKCQSLRVPVSSFRPNQSQRRAWKRNEGKVTIRIGSPASSPEKLDLFARFHQHGHETKGWPQENDPDLDLFLLNPFQTEEWCYYVGERLVAVGYVDVPSEALSAIYFFHDPEDHQRSLGTFNILKIIEAARERALSHVYLGYDVAGCRSLQYKARFRPNEVLESDGAWKLFGGAPILP
jgi:arginine-tRNA-protein transferase